MRWPWQGRAKWGVRLLAIWLIASGLLHFVAPPFPYAAPALAVLAMAAGVLLLLDR